MKNGIATLWLGVWMVFFLWPAQAAATSLIKPDSTLYYHFRMDTMGTDLGYLRLDSMDKSRLTVDRAMGDRSLWRIIYPFGTPVNCYYIINKYSGDTLTFDVPFTPADTLAKITSGGILDRWDELFDYINRDSLKTYNGGNMYYLSYDDQKVYLSLNPSAKKPLTFTIERYKYLPDEELFYQLAVDTLGTPDVLATGFLYTDTSMRSERATDSLIVSDLTDDLAYWKFVTDTIISDTTYFKIYNKATDSLLAFDVPAVDTLAIPVSTGALNQWRIPFFAEDKGIGQLAVCDTLTGTVYYLAMTPDSVIMLVTDTVAVKPLSFVVPGGFEPPVIVEPLDSAIVDSTQIYSVRYVAGPDSGKYLGATEKGTRVLLDTVYYHIPNGQFVINRNNRFSLSNRLNLNVKTDSLFVVRKTTGDTIPNCFHNRVDTFEVLPLNYGALNSGQIEALKENAHLGYKYLSPADLAAHAFAFSFQSSTPADTLNGLIMGHGLDSVMMLLPSGDTTTFTLDQTGVLSIGAAAIGRIAKIERPVYSLRSTTDSSLYVSSLSSPMRVGVYSDRTLFFLKEDTLVNTEKYYFIDYNGGNAVHKLLADVDRHFNMALLDSTDTHLFTIEMKARKAPDEPDDFEYLTDLEEILAGKNKGYYDFRIMDPLMQSEKWLTKNYYHYAVLGKEGESMLRAGSYVPSDLRLWVDTARGPGFNPDKPSFYVVSEVDTTVAGFNGFNVTGYYLHVMDSTSLTDFDEYVVYNDDRTAYYHRANFVKAMRASADDLQRDATLGGTNELTEAEFRFYLQKTGNGDGKYYLVTEAGYGDGGRTDARGYLSVTYVDGKSRIYFGPRTDAAAISFSSSTVANEIIVTPPIKEEVTQGVMIIGRTGELVILNASGQELFVYNVLGQPVVKKTLSSDNESVPVSKGIMIVKVGAKTQKVVVK